MEKVWIRDPVWKKFGSGMEKIQIRDFYPGSATLLARQHTQIYADEVYPSG
jgi:hypothetical protein